MRKKGFTLIELLVVIAIIAMLMAILMPALSKVKKIAMRVVCGTNLKGLGTAQTVYAQDYDDEYAVHGQKGVHTWSNYTDGFQNPTEDWNVTKHHTIGASLYLLVREADVSPKSFVCPASDQIEYDGENTNNLDIVQLWDFGSIPKIGAGSGPTNHVSYSYHQPYAQAGGKSRYAADGTRSAAFAVMADKNPFMDSKLTAATLVNENDYIDKCNRMEDYFSTGAAFTESSAEIKAANAQPHDRESQNVLFADGHAANEKTADVGVKNDNVYCAWNKNTNPTEADVRRGFANGPKGAVLSGTEFDSSLQPLSSDDSFLVNDDVVGK